MATWKEVCTPETVKASMTQIARLLEKDPVTMEDTPDYDPETREAYQHIAGPLAAVLGYPNHINLPCLGGLIEDVDVVDGRISFTVVSTDGDDVAKTRVEVSRVD